MGLGCDDRRHITSISDLRVPAFLSGQSIIPLLSLLCSHVDGMGGAVRRHLDSRLARINLTHHARHDITALISSRELSQSLTVSSASKEIEIAKQREKKTKRGGTSPRPALANFFFSSATVVLSRIELGWNRWN